MAFENVPVTKPSAETYKALEADLCNFSGKVPLHERFRALFTLKALADNASVDIIGKGKRLMSMSIYPFSNTTLQIEEVSLPSMAH